MDQVFGLARPDDRFAKFLAAARERHGEMADVFAPVFVHREKQDEIVRQRRFVTNNEHRFFLALLLNAEGRERIFSLIGKRYPETEPVEKVLDWVLEMSQTRVLGANPPNALGVADFDNFDLFALEHLLNDRTAEEITAQLNADYPGEQGATLLQSLDDRINKIRNAVIFQPLLQ